MEGTESSQKLRKRKTQENIPEVDSKKTSVDHYERRIESLVLNNDALTHALDASHKTIHHQDKLISNLQMKHVSQIPKIIELRLEAMEKVIQQLTVMFEETKALLNSESFAVNSMPLPLNNSSHVNDDVSDKEKEMVNNYVIEPEISSTPIPNHSSKTSQSSKNTSKTNTVLPSPKKIDTSPKKFDTIKVKSDSKTIEERPHDEFMNLPASTSKAHPRLSRKKTQKSPKVPPAPKAVVLKRRVERCKKVDTYNPHSSSDDDDDDESLDIKKKRLKVKFPPQAKVSEKKKSKNDESLTSDTKGKKTMNCSSDSVEIIEMIDVEKTPSSVTNSESVSLPLNDISKESDKIEIISSKSSSPSLPNNKSSRKKSTSSKPTPKKRESSYKSKTKPLKIKSKEDNIHKEKTEEKINGTITKKSSKSCKDLHFDSLFSNVLKEPEGKVNGEKTSPKTTSSRSSCSLSPETSIDLINNQPQVVLMDIFTTPQSTANPLISKSREAFRSLSKLEHKADDAPPVENGKPLFSDSDMASFTEDVPPLDLELECVSEDDPMVPSSSTKETSLTLNKTDTNSSLGLNENSSLLPGFGFFQNSKDKDNSSDKSVDNEINLDTIEQLLANVCDDSFSKDFERDERLVFTYS